MSSLSKILFKRFLEGVLDIVECFVSTLFHHINSWSVLIVQREMLIWK